jgi:hypothetical protein
MSIRAAGNLTVISMPPPPCLSDTGARAPAVRVRAGARLPGPNAQNSSATAYRSAPTTRPGFGSAWPTTDSLQPSDRRIISAGTNTAGRTLWSESVGTRGFQQVFPNADSNPLFSCCQLARERMFCRTPGGVRRQQSAPKRGVGDPQTLAAAAYTGALIAA